MILGGFLKNFYFLNICNSRENSIMNLIYSLPGFSSYQDFVNFVSSTPSPHFLVFYCEVISNQYFLSLNTYYNKNIIVS